MKALYASWEEWNRRGFVVVKGQKSTFRVNGVPQFFETQVTRPKTKPQRFAVWTKLNVEQEMAEEFKETNGDDAYGVLGADF